MTDEQYDFKTVSAKLTRAEFSEFKDYCAKKGLKPATQLKGLIKKEISHPIPVNIAGKNSFFYNKNRDNFSWKVILDNGSKIDVENELTAEYVLQLLEALKLGLDERNSYLRKENKDSVAVPSKMVGRK